jgi:hypothetical protein
VVEVNGVTIEAYPSNHLDAYRSLVSPKFILLDECDFFRPSDQQDVRHVSERYIAKSNPWIVTVSTPNMPGGLFEQIEREPADRCLYHRIFLDYKYGLNKIYTPEDIAIARTSPSFEREYNLKYLGSIGNLLRFADIDACIEEYELPTNVAARFYYPTWVGCDPGFSSSMFGIVVVQ